MSIFVNPMFAADYYKLGHLVMQPPTAEYVYTTWTARSAKHHNDYPRTVVFGHQYNLIRLIEFWDNEFFNVPKEDLRSELEAIISDTFHPQYVERIWNKFEELWNFGHLPLSVYGVPEGTLLPIGIPDHVIFNTNPNFAWLPQFIEDMWSANNWMPSTSATTAFYRRRILAPYVKETCEDMSQLDHMCGDFSLRGHSSLEAGYISGAAHGLSFDRTATIGSNILVKKYYDDEYPMKGTPSLEHSVVEQGVAWMKSKIASNALSEDEKALVNQVITQNWEINLIAEMLFIHYLITEVQPSGVMTYVSDTYDYWGVLTKILPVLKDEILARDGCFSVRPDSGVPKLIICGDPNAEPGTPEFKGTLNILMELFGTTLNSKGYRELPKQVAMIYGDAITEKITQEVCAWCVSNRVSLKNICFGIGAYTYQYVTRDTRGYAIKATDCFLDGQEFPIYKQPKTDPGKKSPKGCVVVLKTPTSYTMVENLKLDDALSTEAFPGNVMVPKMVDGKIDHIEDFSTIKARLRKDEERMEADW